MRDINGSSPVASGTAYLRLKDRIPLGDKGRVTATVADDCRLLSIEHDGLALQGSGPDIPRQWRGRSVEGTLELDDRTDDDGVAGTFTSDDGTAVAVEGGHEGEHFFELGCAGWSGTVAPR